MARGRSKRASLPDGWVELSDGMWIATRESAAVFGDGGRGTIPAGAVVTHVHVEPVFAWDDERAAETLHVRVGGLYGERDFWLAETVPGWNGGPFGLSNGLHYLRPEPLRPARVPEDLPQDVALPAEWVGGEPHDLAVAMGGGTGYAMTMHVGRRRLLSFKVAENDWFSVRVALDVPSLKERDYYKTANPTPLSRFLERAECAWLLLEPGRRHHLPGGDWRPRKVAVSALPADWIAGMRELETRDRDPEARRRHAEAQEAGLLGLARSLIPVVPFDRAAAVLAAGGVLERLDFMERFQSFPRVPVHVVRDDRWKVVSCWIDAERGVDGSVVGMLDPAESEPLVAAARAHMNGLSDGAALRVRWPNRDRQWVLAGDPEAEAPPRLTARTLIAWGEPETVGGQYQRHGRAALGGHWDIHVCVSPGRGGTCWARRDGETGDALMDDDGHHTEVAVVFDEGGADGAVAQAVEWAYAEEVLHLLGGGWTPQRLPPAAFSTDVLEMAARREARELGIDGDSSQHRPSPKRLTAIAWELRRRGSGLGWKLVGESLAQDLGMEEGGERE